MKTETKNPSKKETGFFLPLELIEEVNKYCEVTGVKRNKLAEFALRQYLDRETKKLAKQ